MKFLFTTIMALTAFVINAQAQQISGTVQTQEGLPAEKATVSLLRAKDSSIAKFGLTDAKGAYTLAGAQPGSYLVMATSVGYSTAYSPVIDLGSADVAVPAIILVKNTQQMEGVTVTARKPMVEVKADKMVVNVEGTINATGNDGIELLRRSPGVVLDKDENISMAGKSGVEVYIDGKPSPLKGQELANYLHSLQSANIEAIELITNPSAKYEAAGNAGIINIKLKKNKNFGTNGTVNAGYAIGILPKYNGGFSLNHRNKNINLFGSYNYADNKNYTRQKIYRAQADSVFDQTGVMIGGRRGHNFKAGADYFINNKNTVGIMANGSLYQNSFGSNGTMDIGYLPTGAVNRILKTDTRITATRNNVNFNANYRYADTSGRELNVDADYGLYRNKNNQQVPNIYYRPDGVTFISRTDYTMSAPTSVDLFAIKADYQQKLGKGVLGLGFKSGYVQTDNDFTRYNVVNNASVKDIYRSNTFNYKENINAAYASYNRQLKYLGIQAGLRVENTASKGNSVNHDLRYDSVIHKNYTGLFPNLSFTYAKNPKSQWSLAYSRRIDRPSYENLNPFEFMLNDYLYIKGNTQLRPQYTNIVTLTNTYKYKLTTQLSYSHVKDMFAQIIDTTERSKSFQTTRNLNAQDVVSLNISYPFVYKNKLTIFNNLTSSYSRYHDNTNGKSINLNNFTVQYFMQSSYKFGKGWAAELSGLYISPSLEENLFKSKTMGSVDAGMQKNILKDKGTLKASVTDIFHTMHFRGDMGYAGTYNRVQFNWESRQLKLNFTYRFGNAQVKAARQRKTAIEEEQKRTGGSN